VTVPTTATDDRFEFESRRHRRLLRTETLLHRDVLSAAPTAEDTRLVDDTSSRTSTLAARIADPSRLLSARAIRFDGDSIDDDSAAAPAEDSDRDG
jgi:hypothetical protein